MPKQLSYIVLFNDLILKGKQNKILIIEQSDIIRNGLYALLKDKNNTQLFIEQCSDENDLQHYVHKISPQILIANPFVFEQNEKQINALKEKYHMLSVGVVYTFYHPDRLSRYDAVIYLSDKTEKIQETIDELLKSYEPTNDTSPIESLTSREKEILKLLVNGNTTKQIATTLHISVHTVNAHRKNIMRKLDIKTVSGLTIYAVLNNIISLKEA